MRTLVITNDFPPRPGGIQSYVHGFASRLPADEVVVLASTWRGAATFDAAQPFPVVRADTGTLLPTASTLRLAREVATVEGCDRVWFGAAAPLALLAGRLGLQRSVASTHGHEVLWAAAPGTRQALRRIGREVDAVTYLGDYTRTRLASALSQTTLVHLPGGVDTEVFHPDCGGEQVRATHQLSDRPVVVCVSRLVPRKGQDTLIRALPLVRKEIPGAALLLVGGGPAAPRLHELAVRCGVAADVRFTGTVPAGELPAHYDAGDVFAMPCRSRWGGLEVEGLGLVFLEAAATGLPVLVGRSGGSADAVLDERTGFLVDGVDEVARRLVELLGDRDRARRMGAAGRAWVEQEWRWDLLAARLQHLLAG